MALNEHTGTLRDLTSRTHGVILGKRLARYNKLPIMHIRTSGAVTADCAEHTLDVGLAEPTVLQPSTTYVYIYINKYIHIHTHIYIHIYSYIHTHTHTYTYIRTYIHTYPRVTVR